MSPRAGELLVKEIVPRLRYAVPKSIARVRSEDIEELVQDSIAIAAGMLHRSEESGKMVTAGNIAFYTLLRLKEGRRSGGSGTVDVYQTQTQLSGKSRLFSTDETHEEGESSLGDTLALDEEDPAMQGARHLDWEAFMITQDVKTRKMIQGMVEGRTWKEIAIENKISPAAVQMLKNVLAVKLKEFMGQNILQESQRPSQWQRNIQVIREQSACKEDHR